MTDLKAILLDTLSSAKTGGPYALIDYPNYLNPGDAAIWLGAREALSRLNGAPPAYSSTLKGFSVGRCRAAIDEGVIYFLGGGSFGDLYTGRHLARLRVIASLSENPIVVLPSSCAWSRTVDRTVVAETRRILQRRAPTRIFARETRSSEQFAEILGVESTLCPDLVHALNLEGPAPSMPIRAILRSDREAAARTFVEHAPDHEDWRNSRNQRLWNKLGKLALALAPIATNPERGDWLARKKAQGAIETLARGRILITDRLHAFLFGAAIGREVVILNNATGKVFAYHETWSGHFPRVRQAAGLEEAIKLAQEIDGPPGSKL